MEIILPNKYNKKRSRIMTCKMTDCLKGLTLKILNSIDIWDRLDSTLDRSCLIELKPSGSWDACQAVMLWIKYDNALSLSTNCGAHSWDATNSDGLWTIRGINLNFRYELKVRVTRYSCVQLAPWVLQILLKRSFVTLDWKLSKESKSITSQVLAWTHYY